MLKENKIYYIQSIKSGGKEVSEDNPIWIKCETWQWGNIKTGRGKQKEMTYETDRIFSEWEMPHDIHIKSSIHLFNRPGEFGEMTPQAENTEHIEFELKELEIDKINENVLPILEIELISLLEKCPIIRCSFKEIIETNFMIVDHLVYPEYMQESVSAYKGLCPELQNIWSGESRETNMKLLSGISDEDPKSDKFKCFGNPPIAFPPKYHQMSVMEEGILRGKFDGENIFRWYGRTEGLIIRIDCEYGKTIKYERNGRAVAVFNDYEKSIIYPSEK